MAPRTHYFQKIYEYAQNEARDEELPILLEHLDAYVRGITEAVEEGRLKPTRVFNIEELKRRAHEVQFWIQDALKAKGWTLRSDAKTWVAP